jgi:DNA polymerase III alpha subunit
MQWRFPQNPDPKSFSALATEFLLWAEVEPNFSRETVQKYGECLKQVWKVVGDKSVSELSKTDLLRLKSYWLAGAVITRQRPGTAKGLIFVTLEDETGNANVIVMPDVYERYRQQVLEPKFIRVHGTVQNQDGIVHLRVERVESLMVSAAQVASHDFH